jgi:hypothetical protein
VVQVQQSATRPGDVTNIQGIVLQVQQSATRPGDVTNIQGDCATGSAVCYKAG